MLENMIVSQFESNDDLYDGGCCAVLCCVWKGRAVSQCLGANHLSLSISVCLWSAACCASSTIPGISERVGGLGSGRWGLRRYKGHLCMDGGVTNNCPVFRDHIRRQLVFRLGELDYSAYRSLSPTDDCIEVLVIRGAMLMAQFLEGGYCRSFSPSGLGCLGLCGAPCALLGLCSCCTLWSYLCRRQSNNNGHPVARCQGFRDRVGQGTRPL